MMESLTTGRPVSTVELRAAKSQECCFRPHHSGFVDTMRSARMKGVHSQPASAQICLACQISRAASRVKEHHCRSTGGAMQMCDAFHECFHGPRLPRTSGQNTVLFASRMRRHSFHVPLMPHATYLNPCICISRLQRGPISNRFALLSCLVAL